MSIIELFIDEASKNKKIIVLPESEDVRVVEAASIIVKEGISNIILLGDENKIKSDNPGVNLDGVTFIDPTDSKYTEKLINEFYLLRKDKGLSLEEARKTISNDYIYYACMLVKEGIADGVVSGACHSTANTLRPALQIIKSKNKGEIVSSFFLMDTHNNDFGSNGILAFADCGLIQDPTSEELASIANQTSKSFETLVKDKAKVALLSHSTKGSAKHDMVTKVVDALKIAKKKFPDILIDGEMQADAALVPSVAKLKCPDSRIAGNANVLVFPNLDSGNIAYKLVQRIANADAYGPITQGLNNPVNDLSRGCSANDIVGVVAITSLQCNK